MWSWAVFWIVILSGSFVAAVALYDLYRRRKKEFDDFEKDLVLVCRLARFPYETKGNEDLCMTLMTKSQISPNAQQTDGLLCFQTTPFLSACYGGSLRLIQFMLENGASIQWCNLNGDSALYIAIYGITCRLQSAQRTTRRSSEIQLGILLVDCLVTSGCDIDVRNKSGFTPLHWASITGEKWLVDHLLKRGANPLVKTVLSGALPSAFASEMKQLQVHVLLKEAEYNFKSP